MCNYLKIYVLSHMLTVSYCSYEVLAEHDSILVEAELIDNNRCTAVKYFIQVPMISFVPSK